MQPTGGCLGGTRFSHGLASVPGKSRMHIMQLHCCAPPGPHKALRVGCVAGPPGAALPTTASFPLTWLPCPLRLLRPPLQITLEELNVMDKLPHYCPVCAYHEWNLDGLMEMIWE